MVKISVNLREVFVSFVIEDEQILAQIDQLDKRVDDLVDKISTLDESFGSLGTPLEELTTALDTLPSEVDIELKTNVDDVEKEIEDLFYELNTIYTRESPVIPDIGGIEEAKDAIDGVILKLEDLNRVFAQVDLDELSIEEIEEGRERLERMREEVALLEDELDQFIAPSFQEMFPTSFVEVFEERIQEMFSLLRRESDLFEEQISQIETGLREPMITEEETRIREVHSAEEEITRHEIRAVEEHIESVREPIPEPLEPLEREEVITPVIEEDIDREITEKLGQIELDIIQPVSMIVEEMPPIELDERQLPIGVFITDDSMRALDEALDLEPVEVPLTSHGLGRDLEIEPVDVSLAVEELEIEPVEVPLTTKELEVTATAAEEAGIEPTYRAHETIAGLELAEYAGIPELQKEEPREKVRLVEFKPEVNIGPVTVKSEADLDALKEKVMESLSELIHEEAERRE